ncbi:NERD nuclease [Virgibacillus soli]|nr:NERD nuclease [Virgibacillus soli]
MDVKQTLSSANKISNNNKLENERIAVRKGELGEYKIDIQLSQMPKEYMYLSDLLIKNPRSATGYSQIDHVIITPYGFFVIETKNYQGTIYGGKNRKTWLINGKFKMMNPLRQNYSHIQALKNFIEDKYHPHFISMISFTRRCTLNVGEELREINSNELVIYDIKFTEFINRKMALLKLQYKEPILTEVEIKRIYDSILNSNITDPSIRKQHVDSIQRKKINNKKIDNENKCVVCQKLVSDKVKSYCLSNKKYGGKIYCFEHQKTV